MLPSDIHRYRDAITLQKVSHMRATMRSALTSSCQTTRVGAIKASGSIKRGSSRGLRVGSEAARLHAAPRACRDADVARSRSVPCCRHAAVGVPPEAAATLILDADGRT